MVSVRSGVVTCSLPRFRPNENNDQWSAAMPSRALKMFVAGARNTGRAEAYWDCYERWV
jgi:hypothetical protein